MNYQNQTIDRGEKKSPTPTLKAIPAEFNGITYRSKNEARWAAFFHHLGISAIYEDEGFSMVRADGTMARYLPDFHVPHQDKFPRDIYFEIKPSVSGLIIIDDCDKRKIEDISKFKIISVLGSIHDYEHELFHYGRSGYDIYGPNTCDNFHLFCQCIFCGAFGFEYLGRSERIKCCSMNDGGKHYNERSDEILSALNYSKSLRFWK
jgi:hypothetical protein